VVHAFASESTQVSHIRRIYAVVGITTREKFDLMAAAESLVAAKSPKRSHNLAALVKGASYDRKTD
jgi:hypothetical protein